MSKPTYQFDKFVKDLADREKKRNQQREQSRKPEVEPQRRLNRLYRELWQNRVKWGNR